VPSIASPAKLALIRSYGAELVMGGERYDDVLAACDQYAAETGALAVHAYDQPETLLGQGSVGLEFEQDAPDLDTLFVAVGGGGLIGGIAAWYAGRVKLIGVEPELAPPSTRRWRPARRWMPRPAASPPIPWRRGAWGRSCSPSPSAMSRRCCWSPTRRSVRPRRPSGGRCGWSPSRWGHRPWPRCSPASIRPKPGERIGVLLCGANTTAVDFTR
jgi:Threonine dehydratase